VPPLNHERDGLDHRRKACHHWRVDTHADLHVAAALEWIGGLLGTESFATTAVGYTKLSAWLRSFGPVSLVGVEGTGSYWAGLARHLAGAWRPCRRGRPL
jgi:transposase